MFLLIIGSMISSGCQPQASTTDQQGTTSETTREPLAESFKQMVPGSLVEFEMLLVPGNAAADIQPFYIGKHEVTWDEFAYWALCEDITEKKGILQREKLLRPSAPHDSKSIYRGWGRDGQPAVGISRVAAEKYCQWLSERTGKSFRLPTPQEWDYAFEQGGDSLEQDHSADQLNEMAWYLENSLDSETFDNRAMPVGQKQANQLGIHDMLGNAAEWVSGEQPVVRGGSFLTKPEALRGAWSETEDQSVWNRNYPNDPKSIWWYVDADYVGFRLVCDPPPSK